MEEVKKKKFPLWAKVLLGIFVLFFVGTFAISFAIRHFLTGKRGEDFAKATAEKVLEKMIEESSEGDAKVDVDFGEKGEGVTIKGKDGKEAFAFQAGENMPADFPTDIAVFSPSEFKGHVSLMGMRTFSWESAKPIQEVARFYQEKMPANGWQSAANRMDQGGYVGTFKKQGREVMLSVSGEGDTTQISVVYGLPK